MNIIGIYAEYLKHQETLRERDENVFHASSAGGCYRKQMYSYYGYPSDSKDEQSYRLLRLGTIFHKDMEKALQWYQDQDSYISKEMSDKIAKIIYSEVKIELKNFDVVGTFDAGEMDNGTFNLYDFKTAAAYKWTTKFGLKKNRNPDTDTNYKLQLGTYALGVKQKYKPDKINMFLVWYNKNTSQMREQIVSNEWIEKAEEYWEEVYDMKEELNNSFEDALIPEMTYGVPMQDWECRYCQFYSICPSKLAEKKKRY
jgi:hypothetical protein